MRFRLTVLLLVSLTGTAFSAPPGILPAEWLPALSPSIKAALTQLKEASTQSEMNLLSRQVADMTDAQVFIAYVRLYERLSPAERKKLRDEQARWLKQRAKAAKAAVESKGGSLAALEANNAEVTYSEKRLVELRNRYKPLAKTGEPDE